MASVFTSASVEKLKANAGRRQELPDAGLPGLYLIIQPGGSKSWAFRYRFGGKTRKMTIGRYPATDLVTARSNARRSIQVLEQGRDPASEKLEQKRKVRDGEIDQTLVGGAIENFLKRYVRPKNNRYAEETERLINLHVLPSWRVRRLDSIKRTDVVELLDRIVDRGAPVAANRALAAVRKFFNWSVDRGLIEASPCTRLKPPTEEKARDRVLSDSELRLIWLATDDRSHFSNFVRLLLLTAQRRDEVARITAAELDKDRAIWTIPKHRTKNGMAQDIPLSPLALCILMDVDVVSSEEGYLLTTNGRSPISGFAKGKARVDSSMISIARREAEIRGIDPAKVAISPWRLHDLRRTAATGMARLGQPVNVIEAVLNHVSGQLSGVAGIYNRHRYLEEKGAALNAWAGHVALVAQCGQS